MTDSLDTSDREAEDPREPIRLPVREMRDEPVPHQAADPIRAALQLALEATPEELPAALSAVRAALAAQQAGVQVPSRPDVLERLSYHALERDDLSLDDCLAYLAKGWATVHGRTERQMVMQILSLLAAAPEAPAQAAPSADEVERGDVVAFEFYNRATGHAIVDYSVNTHVGNLSADKGYEARPLVYADKREEVTDGSKPIPLWQAREALDELEAAARGDAPFNHQAAAVVRAALATQPTQGEAPSERELPPLPDTPYQLYYEWPDDEDGYGGSEVVDGDAYTADQMRAYARAALASQPQAEAVPVAQVEIIVPHLRSIVVKHIPGAPLPKVGDHLYPRAPTQASQPQAVDAEDAARLDWMIFHSARVMHTSDGEYCRVEWADDEWKHSTAPFGNARAAIDAARRAGG